VAVIGHGSTEGASDEQGENEEPTMTLDIDRQPAPDLPAHDRPMIAPGSDPRVAVRAVGASKVHGRGDAAVHALDGVTVEFLAGQFTATMGPSGSGKSTLMHCLAGLDTLTSGTVHIGDVDITGMKEKQLTVLRREQIGFVFQSFNLVPTLTALENITLPLSLAGHKPDREWLELVVDAVNLGNRLHHKPSELSGGQQQRVAVARTLVSRPAIVFADEPTGNLDSRTGQEVLELLRVAATELGQTTVMVTHDAHAATIADRVLFLGDGRIVNDLPRSSAADILSAMERIAS